MNIRKWVYLTISIIFLLIWWFFYPPKYILAKRLTGIYPDLSMVFGGITAIRSGSHSPAIYWKMSESDFTEFKCKSEKKYKIQWQTKYEKGATDGNILLTKVFPVDDSGNVDTKIEYNFSGNSKHSYHMCYIYENNIFLYFNTYGSNYFEN